MTSTAARRMSSRNYIVLDVSAGPSTYGPATSGKQGGVVGPGSFPALRVRAAPLRPRAPALRGPACPCSGHAAPSACERLPAVRVP